MSQFQLLKERRFLPLFLTQFFGAFNDNLFKATLSLIFVFSGMVAADNTNFFVNAAAGLFILPFFLFSATAGQLADKYEKGMLIRILKFVEVLVAVAGAYAVYSGHVYGMLSVLFLLGVQSAFFGPLKYSILPQHLSEAELTGGNAQVEMGTFVAILLGTLVAGLIAQQSGVIILLSTLVITVAVLGLLSSWFIPHSPATAPGLRVNLNPYTETLSLIALARANRSVFLSIMGISWYWFVGATYLTQIPNLTREYLFGDASVVTLILAVFTIFVAVGSLICERLSGGKIEVGLVPFGALGLSIAGLDLSYASSAMVGSETLDWVGFLMADGSIRLLLDMGFVGLFGGVFIVPLYALIQMRTPPEVRARIIAVNNIINAVFMAVAAIFAIVMLTIADISIPNLMLTLIIMNVAVCVFIFHQIPEFSMRFIIWLLSHTMYRVTHKGLENVPDEGAAIIVCNHVSFVDALLLAGAVRRPIRFIMYKPIFDIPVLNFVFRTGGAIPIAGKKEDEEAFERAFGEIQHGLESGDLLCIFPEGKLTNDGEIDDFKRGIERILEKTPVPVVPFALKGLWGSYFSRDGGLLKNPKRFWSRVEIEAGAAIAPGAANAEMLRDRVMAMRGEAR